MLIFSIMYPTIFASSHIVHLFDDEYKTYKYPKITKEYGDLLKEQPYAWAYGVADLSLYLVQIIYHIWGLCKTNIWTIGYQKYINPVFDILQIIVTSFGIHHVWSTEMEQLVLKYEQENKDIRANPKYFEVYQSLNLLLWLRVSMFILYISIGIMVCLYVAILYCMGF